MPASTNYLTLLRGINVGGNNLIKMGSLRDSFERNGFVEVSTYIQSGNVLFRSRAADVKRLTRKIERMLSKEFSYEARVVVVSHDKLRGIVEKAPKGFGTKPADYLSDVIFLRPPLTAAEAMREVQTREGVDKAAAGDGVLYFSRLKAKASRSRLSKIVSSPIYPQVTIRSWGTTTKLLGKLDELDVTA
jgi:uncharacterized protein (DUF1697 family)